MSLLGEGYFVSHISVPLVLEYESVLMRQHQALGLTTEDVLNLVDAICKLSQWHEIHYLWRPMLPDANDEMILELAIKAGSASIVTYNERDFEGAASFGVAVITPKAFLEELGLI